MSSKRDKKSGYIYKLCKKLEDRIDLEYEAEQEETTIKLEAESEDDQEIIISETTSEALLTSLKMTCSDSEDSSQELPGIGAMPNALELQNGCTTKESTIATVINMFTSISKQIATIHKKTERVQREVTTISERLGRVEKKMGISLATIEQVKDVIVKYDDAPEKGRFVFNKITNEEEFTELDTKLGTDQEYYESLKKDLNQHVQANEADNRMLEMMDMIYDRKFMTLCSWTGCGREGTKIAFRERKNILQLFADIASNKFMTVSETFVKTFFVKKLRHAKERVNIQGLRKAVCHKRRSILATAIFVEEQPKQRRE
ncbi:uncharacterized protein LOC128303048 [Anopheles moucheti]|uniref:uncharacterized protein LOC128303048 n=1 Tax=Anopheles moucheti TaxID=186751 RepID=UPI0022F11E16|nr:uncharacterized protein LOC128303048 [Anopheles moucheti]